MWSIEPRDATAERRTRAFDLGVILADTAATENGYRIEKSKLLVRGNLLMGESGHDLHD